MSTLNVSDVTADHPDPLDQQLVRELEAVFRAHYRMTYRTAYARPVRGARAGAGLSTEDAQVLDALGLKLESSKTTVEVLVIDYIERPSEN